MQGPLMLYPGHVGKTKHISHLSYRRQAQAAAVLKSSRVESCVLRALIGSESMTNVFLVGALIMQQGLREGTREGREATEEEAATGATDNRGTGFFMFSDLLSDFSSCPPPRRSWAPGRT